MEKYLQIARKAVAATAEGSFRAKLGDELDERNEISSKLASCLKVPTVVAAPTRNTHTTAAEERASHISGVVELVFVEPREKVTPISPDFPPCPDCASARYWISSLGKVVCGQCGETRFMLASISYHPVN